MPGMTLREARQRAKQLGILYDKNTTLETLLELIVAAELEKPPVDDAPGQTNTFIDQFNVPEIGITPAVSPAPPFIQEAPKRDFQAELEINIADLNEEFKTQAARFGYYASLEAKAQGDALRKKLQLEVTEANLYRDYRDQATKDGAKTTEKQLEASVASDPRYKAANLAYIEAKQHADYCKAARIAMDIRNDMLIQLGSSRRQELDQAHSTRLSGGFGKAA